MGGGFEDFCEAGLGVDVAYPFGLELDETAALVLLVGTLGVLGLGLDADVVLDHLALADFQDHAVGLLPARILGFLLL